MAAAASMETTPEIERKAQAGTAWESEKYAMTNSTRLDDTGKPVFASVIDAAIAMPNIDGRPSVLTELPDIFVEGGMEGVAEKAITLSVRWGKPHDQERVRCHPDPERTRVVMAIKD